MFPTLERELELLASYQRNGHAAAAEELLRGYGAIVIKMAGQYYNQANGLSMADLVQEGKMGLLHAAKAFQPARDCRYSTYATLWVRQHIARAIEKYDRTIHISRGARVRQRTVEEAQLALFLRSGVKPSVDDLAVATGLSVDMVISCLNLPECTEWIDARTQIIPDSQPPLYVDLEYKELLATVIEAIRTLPEETQRLLILRLGLFGYDEHTPADIARKLGTEYKPTAAKISRALKRLRQLLEHSTPGLGSS